MYVCGHTLNRVMDMKKPRYLLWVLAVEAVGLLSAIFSREGMKLYAAMAEKPALSPPGILFPIVWTVLYGLMGAGAARIAAEPDSRDRSRALNVFVAQLVVNFFWSLIFFNAQAYGLAFVWLMLLWVLIAAMILLFRRIDPAGAWLQLPYLLWVTFAGYLNLMVWRLKM